VNPLELLEDPLRALLDFLHENANLTYGWSIVVLTVIVRLVLLPLVIKQYSSMRRMQLYAPQMKELQQKYKGNRQKLNEELMAFYKENEINPFSSCLPLVAQLPVFIALYYVLRDFANDATVSGGDVSFMWVIPDVRLEFTDIGWGAAVIVIIYACSQLLSTELSMTPNMPDSQRRLMRLLPVGVIVFLFIFPVPAGLVLYWMTTNLWTCGQQLVMRHRIGLHLADPAEVEAITKKGSRTEPAAAAAAVAASAAEAPAEGRPRTTPRKRRRGAAPGANGGAAAPEPEPAPEPDLAEAEAAPEPVPEAEAPEAEAPEAEAVPAAADGDAPTPAPEDVEGEQPVEASASSGSRGGSGGARRRQPRARGTAKGSRPAPPRSKKRKR
jgi:YidC/Oxa1 family membrane protein insertase